MLSPRSPPVALAPLLLERSKVHPKGTRPLYPQITSQGEKKEKLTDDPDGTFHIAPRNKNDDMAS
jgi:hypothetical protein